MTPLELIKHGVLNNDMLEVSQGYLALTGEDLQERKSDMMDLSNVSVTTPTPIAEVFHYECLSCGEKFIWTTIDRKACVRCRKRNIGLVGYALPAKDSEKPAPELGNDLVDQFRTDKNKRTRGKVSFKGNTFIDKGVLSKKEESKIAELDKLVKAQAPVERIRSKYQKTKVTCSVCRQEVQVDPIMLENTSIEFFRCDKCVSSRTR